MRHVWNVLAVAVALCLTAGFSTLAQTKPPAGGQPPKEVEVITPDTWRGLWDSDWGMLRVEVKGRKAAGSFDRRSGLVEGEISADGRQLSGIWCQAPSYVPGRDGGVFLFILTPNGRSFEGFVWLGGAKGGAAREFMGLRPDSTFRSGQGPKVEPKEKPGFAGKWDTDWGAMILEANGPSVKGIFSQGDGRIEGTVSGDSRQLAGTWLKAPTYTVGKDGGSFIFVLSPSGRSIRGTYWNSAEAKGIGTRFNGVRKG
jgi:hypothetical protein